MTELSSSMHCSNGEQADVHPECRMRTVGKGWALDGFGMAGGRDVEEKEG
jgi:hypothetical protein